MYGNVGKKRSKFGEYLDKNGITQSELLKYCKVNKDTITKVCRENEVSNVTKRKLLEGLNKLTRENKKVSDFW